MLQSTLLDDQPDEDSTHIRVIIPTSSSFSTLELFEVLVALERVAYDTIRKELSVVEERSRRTFVNDDVHQWLASFPDLEDEFVFGKLLTGRGIKKDDGFITHPPFFQLKKIQDGSLVIDGFIIGCTAAALWILQNTYGTSVKEAWKTTRTHRWIRDFLAAELGPRSVRIQNEFEQTMVAQHHQLHPVKSRSSEEEEAFDCVFAYWDERTEKVEAPVS